MYELEPVKILSNLSKYRWHHSKGKLSVYVDKRLVTFNINTKKFSLPGKYGKDLDAQSLQLLLDIHINKL
jgi:hypothetical protein